MAKKYEESLKNKLVRLHLENGRTQKSLTTEYGLGAKTLNNWIKQYRKECETNSKMKKELEIYAENRRLKAELAESKKENDFLKKAAAFFAKEIE